MENNGVIGESAPMAEFDKSPPSLNGGGGGGGGGGGTGDSFAGEDHDLPPPPSSVALHVPNETPPQVPIPGSPTNSALPPPSTSAATSGTTTVAVTTSSGAVLAPGSPKKHRHYEEEHEWACTNWFEYMLMVVLASLLLLGALTLVLFWVLYYRKGFAWTENPQLQFNLHPVLMVAGFITFSGFSLLLYRVCRCCRRIYVKLLHTIFHALAIPCIVVGFLAVLDSHNLATPPIPNFYSLHSWMGLVTMGLFALQVLRVFIVGFFSFLILLCCEGATAAFRASLVPIHASFGITTFMLAVATCLTGLTEKALFTLNTTYSEFPEEGIIVNALAMVLVALGILLSYAVRRESFRSQFKSVITERL
ncbi:plasma membrane ascorbate-dependent reductase CYBRD1 isoform X2 [Ischnura elegans]|uniref:plasma membrane ascorbate-dependent reductase CYBRD1 isoform X2 n=1 Tax=Ischnura elegans TaxID=197161 RepID=UPI001ED877EB|nr:plasma membrane ascorbate-dependent reductase CYBRD1 isoform X2 [Ischnura elegans]